MKIRNVFSMFMLAVAMLFVVGCGDSADSSDTPSTKVEKLSPSKVVEKFFDALYEGNVEEASEYCTSADPKKIKAFLTLAVLDIENDDGAKKEIEEIMEEIATCEEKINGNIAEVAPEGEEDYPIILKKVDGEWKIDFSEVEK